MNDVEEIHTTVLDTIERQVEDNDGRGLSDLITLLVTLEQDARAALSTTEVSNGQN